MKEIIIFFLLTIVIMTLILKLITVNKKLKNTNEKLNNTIKTNNAMLDISEIAITTEDANNMLDFVLEKAIEVIGKTNKGSIMKLTEEGNLEFIASKGFDVEELRDASLKLEDTFLWVKITHRKNGKNLRKIFASISANHLS